MARRRSWVDDDPRPPKGRRGWTEARPGRAATPPPDARGGTSPEPPQPGSAPVSGPASGSSTPPPVTGVRVGAAATPHPQRGVPPEVPPDDPRDDAGGLRHAVPVRDGAGRATRDPGAGPRRGRPPGAVQPRWMRPSPVAPLLRVSIAAGAGDALVAVALANTAFFGAPVGEARGRVALYLLLTMVPFAVVAPLVGPLLDRTRAGRRGALAATLLGRGVLAWVLAQAPEGLRLYPTAFAILILAKAYGVARSAAVPRLIEDGGDDTLVGTNARLSATTIAAGTLAAVLGLGLGKVSDYGWVLRVAALVFLVGGLLAFLLPNAVNSAPGTGNEPERVRSPRFPPAVRDALVSALSIRALSGFLTMFLAFLLRRDGSDLQVGLLAASVALGSAVGTALGAGLRRSAPARLMVMAVGLGSGFCVAAAYRYSVTTALLAACAASVAGALAKIALDATLQSGFGDEVRGQAFARSETALQLAWVAGGGIGLALPLDGGWGLGTAAVALLLATAWTRLRARRRAPVT
jgi:hypothetical protein